jgi:hypothetical protein
MTLVYSRIITFSASEGQNGSENGNWALLMHTYNPNCLFSCTSECVCVKQVMFIFQKTGDF